jgi:hypothetical protein
MVMSDKRGSGPSDFDDLQSHRIAMLMITLVDVVYS